jgi:hypothetical protein
MNRAERALDHLLLGIAATVIQSDTPGISASLSTPKGKIQIF